MLDYNCSFQKCRWFTKTANLINLSIYLFCLLFWEFISLSVRRLCFLRNFHTVLPSYCTRLHSLQPFRRFPDLQASSVFMILLVGFLLVVILTVRWCITVLFYISCYLAMLSISFASCPSKGRSCPPPPPQPSLSSWGAQSLSPQSAWSIPGPGMRPAGPSLSGGFLSTALCLVFLLSFEMNIYIFWNIIALQCCVRFCWIISSISHRYIYTHYLLNLPPAISVSPL